MTEIFFITQIDRLKRRFGEKHFDIEFTKLAAIEVRSMSEMGLQRAVDVWIGSRPNHKAPLLSEFREARLNEERFTLERNARGAIQAIDAPASRGLKNILEEQYGNVTSVVEAIEYVKLKKQIEKANGGPPDETA